MRRKNIFELLSSNFNLATEAVRIDRLFRKEILFGDWSLSKEYGIPEPENHTLTSFVDKFCFEDWKNRGRFIDVDDFLTSIDYENRFYLGKSGVLEHFIELIEIVYNFWQMAENKRKENNADLSYYSDFVHLQSTMNEVLAYFNHKAVYDDVTEQVFVIEDKPEVTAVAEIVEPELALSVLRYNHHAMQGNVEAKRSVLNAMGQALEPKEKELKTVNPIIKDNVFYMLNNLHIRHNNIRKDEKYYKEYIAMMEPDELELWYDELYQMMLLANLELDQVERTSRCKELRAKIEGGSVK